MATLKSFPSSTLVVTVKDDAVALKKLLRALEQQTHFPQEVILAVAQSSDDTLSLAQNAKPNTKVRVLKLGSVTRSAGRNAALNLAKTEVLVCTDAGCLPEPTWLEHLLEPFRDPTVKLVSGYTDGEVSSIWEEVQVPYVLVPLDRIGPHPLPATRNWAVRRQTWERIGPFREDLNWAEDYEWAWRAAASGVQSVFAPRAVVRWRPRATPTAFFSMIERLSFGDMQAGTWRAGHATMWGRYLFFAAIFFLVASLGNLLTALAVLCITWFAYAVLKATRYHYTRWSTYALVPLVQFLADMAVLIGTARGMGVHFFQHKTDEKDSTDL